MIHRRTHRHTRGHLVIQQSPHLAPQHRLQPRVHLHRRRLTRPNKRSPSAVHPDAPAPAAARLHSRPQSPSIVAERLALQFLRIRQKLLARNPQQRVCEAITFAGNIFPPVSDFAPACCSASIDSCSESREVDDSSACGSRLANAVAAPARTPRSCHRRSPAPDSAACRIVPTPSCRLSDSSRAHFSAFSSSPPAKRSPDSRSTSPGKSASPPYPRRAFSFSPASLLPVNPVSANAWIDTRRNRHVLAAAVDQLHRRRRQSCTFVLAPAVSANSCVVPGWTGFALAITGFSAAIAAAKSPPAQTLNAKGKLFGPNTTTGPMGAKNEYRFCRVISNRPPPRSLPCRGSRLAQLSRRPR